jgi:2-polyprenyl-3-methyl-5-hydroxy-6-metoxy-1,4-benzoquinol methylase
MKPINDSVIIKSTDDVYTMLDEIMKKWDSGWWDRFYSDKNRAIPFFRCIPDENLHTYVRDRKFRPGRVLDIGCGIGRNAIFLAKNGFSVDAIDFSATSLAWAKENAIKEDVQVNFICESIFNYAVEPGSYDNIYDSGCLHHIKPHRRSQYLEHISGLLKPEGYFGLTCFNPNGAAPLSDYTVYQEGSMNGGMGYTEQKLKAVLADYFEILEFRQMKEIKDGDLFGEDFLWCVFIEVSFV